MDNNHSSPYENVRRRSKSDTTPRDENYVPQPMTHSIGYENHIQDLLEGHSDLNAYGEEYRPRTSSNPSSRGRPPSSSQKVAQATRHARRLYFGGFNASTEEETLKSHLNEVISAALGEPNDNSYILSIYLNQKKSFAFVELKSIELTSACLSLDGMMMDGVPLKVQRANEYKPDVVPPVKSVIRLDLSKVQMQEGGSQQPRLANEPVSDDGILDRVSVHRVDLNMVKSGDIVLVTFVSAGATSGRLDELSDSNPLSSRGVIRNYLQSISSSNPEYGVDVSDLNVVDLGDVQISSEDVDADSGRSGIQSLLSNIMSVGALPVILGAQRGKSTDVSASSEDSIANAAIRGAIKAVLATNTHSTSPSSTSSHNQFHGLRGAALLSVSARIHPFCRSILRDSEFSAGSEESMGSSLRAFGLQGTHCTMDSARYLLSHGGALTWLTKDIRSSGKKISGLPDLSLSFDQTAIRSPKSVVGRTVAGQMFVENLQKLCTSRDSGGKPHEGLMPSYPRVHSQAVILSLHPDASFFPGVSSPCPANSRCLYCSNSNWLSGEGFTAQEWLDMAMSAGHQKNVCIYSNLYMIKRSVVMFFCFVLSGYCFRFKWVELGYWMSPITSYAPRKYFIPLPPWCGHVAFSNWRFPF